MEYQVGASSLQIVAWVLIISKSNFEIWRRRLENLWNVKLFQSKEQRLPDNILLVEGFALRFTVQRTVFEDREPAETSPHSFDKLHFTQRLPRTRMHRVHQWCRQSQSRGLVCDSKTAKYRLHYSLETPIISQRHHPIPSQPLRRCWVSSEQAHQQHSASSGVQPNWLPNHGVWVQRGEEQHQSGGQGGVWQGGPVGAVDAQKCHWGLWRRNMPALWKQGAACRVWQAHDLAKAESQFKPGSARRLDRVYIGPRRSRSRIQQSHEDQFQRFSLSEFHKYRYVCPSFWKLASRTRWFQHVFSQFHVELYQLQR